jgi:hypothetical protein
MNKRLCAVIVFGLAVIMGGAVRAESGINWRGSGGWGAGLPYGRLYQTATVQTLAGEVLRVEKVVPEKGMADGLQLLLKTRDETIPVHLGPLWYLERQDFAIDAGEQVTVLGSRITFEGRPALLAAEVRKADKTLKLRDEAGFPLWSGWRRR